MGNTLLAVEMRRAESNRSRGTLAPAPRELDRALPMGARLPLSLQRTAGNRAVTSLVERWRDGSLDEGLLPGANAQRGPAASGQRADVVRASGALEHKASHAPVIQRTPFTDFLSRFALKAGLKGIGEVGAQIAGPLIEEAQRQAGPLAKQAVEELLRSNAEAIRAVHVAVAAKVAGQASAEAGKALAEQLKGVCTAKLDVVMGALRAEAYKAIDSLPDMTPQAIIDAKEALDARLEAVRQSAIVEQAQSISVYVVDGVTTFTGAVAQGIVSYGFSWGIDQAIGMFLNGKELTKAATGAAAQAIAGSAVVQGAQSAIDTARTGQQVVSKAIGAVDTVVDAVEGRILWVVPDTFKDAATRAAASLKRFLPADAAEAIKPAAPAMYKRAGGYAADSLLGTSDTLAGAEQGLHKAGETAVASGTKAADAAVEKGAAGLPSVATVLNTAQVIHAMANAPTGREPETAGKAGATIALTTVGSALGTSAAALLPAALAVTGAPVILATAGALLATQTRPGKAAIAFAGEVVRESTHFPVVGLPVQKVTETVAAVSAVLGLGGNVLWRSLFGGSDDAVEASKQNIREKASQLGSGWSASNAIWGMDTDVISGLAERIERTFGQGRNLTVDVSDQERATERLAWKAIYRAYAHADSQGIIDSIAQIEVTGKGFKVAIKREQVSFERAEEKDA